MTDRLRLHSAALRRIARNSLADELDAALDALDAYRISDGGPVDPRRAVEVRERAIQALLRAAFPPNGDESEYSTYAWYIDALIAEPDALRDLAAVFATTERK